MCSRKDKDLADARQQIARLQVEVSALPSGRSTSSPLSVGRRASTGEMDSSSATSREDSEAQMGGGEAEDMLLSFSGVERDLDRKDLETQLAVFKQECKLLADDLVEAQVLGRMFSNTLL